MGGLLRAFRACMGAMLGIRRGSAARQDFARIRIWQFAAAGVALVALFVGALASLASLLAG